MRNLIDLFFSFFKIGAIGFGGGYSMLSLIFGESSKLGITPQQFADLNALDMIVPGPIAINAATYVGYLNHGFFGSLFATLGVMMPSFIIVTLVLHFIIRFRENRFLSGFLRGIKPAAVGLVAAAAITIASEVLLRLGAVREDIFVNPFEAFSLFLVGVFAVTAVANIKFKVNPILLTVLAGVAGAFFLK
ncbi:MAG: chromate transporter [Oscillospiraceae bacterium]|nr:chromate transporter [Oscillospiraceae bacterium]